MKCCISANSQWEEEGGEGAEKWNTRRERRLLLRLCNPLFKSGNARYQAQLGDFYDAARIRPTHSCLMQGGERNSWLSPSGLFLAFGTVIDTSSLGRLASRIRCVKKERGGCDFLALDQNVMRGGAHVMKEKLGGGGTQDLYFRGIPLPGERKITEQFY